MKRQKPASTKYRKQARRFKAIGYLRWRPDCMVLVRDEEVHIEQRRSMDTPVSEAERIILHRDQLPELIALLKKAA